MIYIIFAGLFLLVVNECMKIDTENKEDLMVKRIQYEERMKNGYR